MAAPTRLFCDYAFLPSGWVRNVTLLVDAAGDIVDVRQTARADAPNRIGRYVLPGMPNLHSHAFQRAMAGLAERMSKPEDSFWTWRETMYGFAGRVEPDTLAVIAAQLYVEMLKAGYTAVCEFHYVHHRPDGSRYASPAAMAHALLAAAAATGIGVTLLPTLYMAGGFDGRALSERQRRFGHTLDAYVALVEDLQNRADAQTGIGVAIHSLRAVPPEPLAQLLAEGVTEEGPIHVHVAEQLAEVDDCVRAYGKRPVAWLLDNADVDPRWCLVHATHMTRREIRGVAESGAVAGLCPTTEANLGDGLFPLRDFLDAGGAFGIGSDSHVSVSPVEELRWLEYGQRLALLRRNLVAKRNAPSTGENLWKGALVGGAQAAGRRLGAIAAGHRADLLVLDDAAPELAGRDASNVLDTLVFAGNRNLVRDVMVGGRWVVRDGRHAREDEVARRYRKVAERLTAAL
jgi:formimidoylglutamate deiminase